MDMFLVVLTWQVADLQVTTTVVPLPADSQCVGSTTTSNQLGRFPLLTA